MTLLHRIAGATSIALLASCNIHFDLSRVEFQDNDSKPSEGVEDARGEDGGPDAATSRDSGNFVTDAGVIHKRCESHPNRKCTCNEGDTCELSCRDGKCNFACEAGSTCTATCPAGDGSCDFDCSDGADCTFVCEDGGCSFDCDSGATCVNHCLGGGCDTECDDADCTTICTESCEVDCAASVCLLQCVSCNQDCDTSNCQIGCFAEEEPGCFCLGESCPG